MGAEVELRFVSATGANQLRELSERADTPGSLKEFRQAIDSSGPLKAEFTMHWCNVRRTNDDVAQAVTSDQEPILRKLNRLIFADRPELTKHSAFPDSKRTTANSPSCDLNHKLSPDGSPRMRLSDQTNPRENSHGQNQNRRPARVRRLEREADEGDLRGALQFTAHAEESRPFRTVNQ